MKVFKMIIFSFVSIFFLLCFSSCNTTKEVESNFFELYSKKGFLDDFSNNCSTYIFELELDGKMPITLLSMKKENNAWNGKFLYKNEKIPFKVVDNILISGDSEKEIPMENILLFRNFDENVLDIKKTVNNKIDIPEQIVIGEYALDQIYPYLEKLNHEFISLFSDFDYIDINSIRNLDSVECKIYDFTMESHSLKISFSGDDNQKIVLKETFF